MRLTQNEKECKIVICLKDVILKTQCDDLYDCRLIRHLHLTYRGTKAIADDDLVDTVSVRLPPTTTTTTVAAVVRFMRLTILNSL
jgi:hypothetical protein